MNLKKYNKKYIKNSQHPKKNSESLSSVGQTDMRAIQNCGGTWALACSLPAPRQRATPIADDG